MDIEKLRRDFRYDMVSGDFVRIARRSGPNQASDRGSVNDGGYLRIRFCGRKYYVHVLAWAHHHGEFPKHSVDHADGNPMNNSIGNLRLATHQQNCCNRGARKDNATGIKGVCWDKRLKRYRVQVRHDGRRVYQALFSDIEAAAAAYETQAKLHHGVFARTT